MKVYLINVYKQQGNNVWAETQVFTSPRVRDDTFFALPKGTDADKQDVEVIKRPYCKMSPQIEQCKEAPTHE